ncbi:Uncharacterized membrane protein YgdD (TMEM256/DUF423 family) [Tenacibaculum sp. 190524A05c]|uniref:DUF423 domain-containing protein n=1 Tax=Tenacibaculum platacis TaxID=3137852 RepID=UPI0031FB6294
MYKNLTIITLLGALTIILGAFGAHALKETLSPEALQSFETAVRYQMYHVLLLIMVNLTEHFSNAFKRKITWFFLIGILLFSGSIYAIYLGKIPVNYIWFVTPLGGLVLIIGWFLLSYQLFKRSRGK